MLFPKNWKPLKYCKWKQARKKWGSMKECRVCGKFTSGSICKDCEGEQETCLREGILPVVYLKSYLVERLRYYRELEEHKLAVKDYNEAEACHQKQRLICEIMDYFKFHEELKIIMNEVD